MDVPCIFNTAAAAPLPVVQQESDMGTLQKQQELQEEQEEESFSLAQALQALSRKELLDIIVNETGDESRQYVSFTKGKLVDQICTILGQGGGQGSRAVSTTMVSMGRKRGRKPKNAVAAAATEKPENVCKNAACRAPLTLGDSFCRRCSCCICCCYDENKDPSLWMVCGDDPAASPACCGLSCHLECAFEQQLAGVVGNLDGSFLCPSCGNISSLVGIWKKNLTQAKSARRVDLLHQRLSFARKLFEGTKAHRNVQNYVEQAAELLLRDMVPQPCRSIVNRLACGAQVQELIGKALDSLEPSTAGSVAAQDFMCEIRFEEVTPTSVVLAVINKSSGDNIMGYRIYHRRNRGGGNYKYYPTAVIGVFDTATVRDLSPSSAYTFKAVAFSSAGDEGYVEAKCQTKRDENNIKNNKNDSRMNKMCTDGVKQEGIATTVVGSETMTSKNDSVSTASKDALAKYLSSNNNDDDTTSEEKALQVKKPKASTVTKVKKEETSCEVFWDVHMIVDDTKTELHQQPEEPKKRNQEPGKEQQVLQAEDVEDVVEGRQQCPEEVPSSTGVLQLQDQEANGGSEDMVVDADGVEELEPKQQQLLKSSSEDEQSLGEVVPPPALDDPVTIPSKATQDENRKQNDDGKNDETTVDASGKNNCSKSPSPSDPALEAAVTAAAPTEEAIMLPRLSDGSFMDCVRMVRWLECQGHLTSDFRKCFFTWFGLRASEHEKRVVSLYIKTMSDDPAGLAGQLVDAFEVAIATNRRNIDPLGGN